MTMDPGRLYLHLTRTAGQLSALHIRSTRPRVADRLVGLPAAQAVAHVPRLFSLCAQAQGLAARLAWASACGRNDAPAALPLTLCCEIIGEHLWRLLLDWPPLFGEPPRTAELRQWRKQLLCCPQQPATAPALADALMQALPALLPEHWLGMLQEHPAATPLRLLDWGPQAGWTGLTPGAEVGPEANPETGALSRQRHQPEVAALLADGRHSAARLLARRHDLAQLASELLNPGTLAGWACSHRPAAGTGLARVETARGSLLHMMQVNDDRVGAYVIVAPTEWNFDPQGPLPSALLGLPADSLAAARARAQTVVLALDPCVAYEMVVVDA